MRQLYGIYTQRLRWVGLVRGARHTDQPGRARDDPLIRGVTLIGRDYYKEGHIIKRGQVLIRLLYDLNNTSV